MTDYDMPKFYRSSYHKARKEPKCEECRRVINKVETYEYVILVGYGDKRPSVFKTCSYCLIPQKWLLEECNGFLHGGNYDDILEHANEYKKMYLYRWAIGIKTQWKHKINRDQR